MNNENISGSIDTNINPSQDAVDESQNDDIIERLEQLIKEESIITYDPVCVRKRSNLSKGSSMYKFDNPDFSPETLLNDIPTHSPKLNALINKINELDKADMKTHGKLFKHFIFSDLKSGTYGAKLLASALISKGFILGYTATPKTTTTTTGTKAKKRYEKIKLLTDEELSSNTSHNNFFLLASIAVYDQSITVAIKKQILKTMNQRPENIHGELARIIIMDSGYKEGIDLFDIKYIHLFEPSLIESDLKQVIGRGTRTCGQKGLDFHPTQGWPLYVFVYDLSIPDKIQRSFLNTKSTIDLYLKSMNLNVRLFHFANDLEKTTVIGAVDHDLNKNIHSFTIPFIDVDNDMDLLDDKQELLYDGGNIIGGVPKRRLVLRLPKDGDIIKTIMPIPISQTIEDSKNRMGFNEMRDHIREHYSDFAWTPVKMENLCQENTKENTKESEIMKYTPTQDFIRHYFTPMNPLKGILLWQSVGTGKTCSAIATATSTFEREGYTILWVTKTTLKNDIWKNMFDQICNESIRHQIENSSLVIPDEQNKRTRLLSKSWRIRPLSYKQFTNLVSKQNAYYKTLVKLNGEADPLRKTLLIIDEAHKLYGGEEMSILERPDMTALHQAIMNSYHVSGNESVKLMLMTATPITKDPMELIKLLNLCKSTEEQMPTEFDEFAKKYLNDEGKFTDTGRMQYLDEIAGYISYLNREKDARQFAQPQIENIMVPITDNIEIAERFDKKIVRDLMESDVSELKTRILETSKELKGELTDLDLNRFGYLKKDICGDLDSSSKKKCEKIVNQNVKLLVAETKEEVQRIRDDIKQLREIIKERNLIQRREISKVSENIEKYEDEYEEYKGSLLYSLKNNCGIKISGSSILKESVHEHPVIKKYDDKIKEYNDRILELHNKLKHNLVMYKKRMAHLKKILKTDLSELERSVINMTIRDDRKTYQSMMKIKRKEVTVDEKVLKASISKTEKKRKLRYNKIRKTIKNKISKEKQNKRDIEREERALQKILRSQGQYDKEIKHELLKDLVDKYKTKIGEDLLDINRDADEKVILLENKRKQKMESRERKKTEKEQTKIQEKERKKTEKARITTEKNKEKERRKTEKLEKKRLNTLETEERKKEQRRTKKK